MKKPQHVLLIANMPAARNPVIAMFARALMPEYRVTVACADPEATEAAIPGIHATTIFGPHDGNVALRARALLRSIRRRLTGRATSADGEAVGPAAAVRDDAPAAPPRRVAWGVIRTHVSDALTAFTHLRSIRADAIYAIDADVLVAGWMLSKLWRCRFGYYMYEIWPKQFDDYSPSHSLTLAAIEQFGVRRAYSSIVPHVKTGAILVRRYGISRAATAQILVCPQLPAAAARPEPHTPMRFYYHGGLQRGRGIENLVRAMRSVDGASLAIRGIGPLASTIAELIEREGLSDRVRMLDPLPVDRLAEAGTEFDVGVNVTCPDSANHRFNMGFKTYENLASGLALLSSASYVLDPFTREHGVGMTMDGCSEATIVRALRYCVDHPEQVQTWKRRSRALAEQEFNFDIQAARLRALTTAMVRGRRPHARASTTGVAAPLVELHL